MEVPKRRVLKKSKKKNNKPKNEVEIMTPMETFTEPNMVINMVEPDIAVENAVQNIMIPNQITNQIALNKNMLATMNSNMAKTDGQLLVEKMNTFIDDAPIEPLFWVLPNKKSFPQWVTETFVKYRANGKIPVRPKNGKVKPFKYQLMLRDYMQNASPYRGVLLFHELGAGKTLTTLYICENLKTERNIVVLLPASLKPNFIKELMKINPLYTNNPNAIKDKYTFVSYNASNTLAQLKKLGSLDNKVIVIEEVHNLVSKMVSGMSGVSVQGMEIYKMLMAAQNAKVIALSGTPIINDPFEFAVLCNVLRGNIEITNFRIMDVSPKFGETWDFIELEKRLASIQYVD